ncbi:unnamed protein product [Penicillium bialowiezense]
MGCDFESNVLVQANRGTSLVTLSKTQLLALIGGAATNMAFFRITLLRSAIGLPRRSTDVLKALGLKKRMATVFHAVSPSVAGQVMKVKELVQVEECQYRLTKQEVHLERKPDPGYYLEQSATEQRSS